MSATRTRCPAVALVVTALLGAPAVPAAVAGAARAEQVTAFQDPVIDESSGLVVQGDDVLTVNDSGGEPVVYVVDAATGATVGRTTFAPGTVDVEALAGGPDGEVWVGDIGDNARARSEISLYRIDAVSRGDRTVEAPRYDLVYPDGARDAEALLLAPRSGRLFVVSKAPLGGEVFAVPQELREDGPNRLRPVGTVRGVVTDGTFLADGRLVVLRSYGQGVVLEPGTWEERGRFPLPDQEQGEGLATWPDDGARTQVLVSSEGANAPLWSVAVPDRLLRAPEPSDDEGEAAEHEDAGDGDGATGPEDDERVRTDEDVPAQSVIPLGPALAGGALLVALTVAGVWLLRRRIRRSARSRPAPPPPPG